MQIYTKRVEENRGYKIKAKPALFMVKECLYVFICKSEFQGIYIYIHTILCEKQKAIHQCFNIVP